MQKKTTKKKTRTRLTAKTYSILLSTIIIIIIGLFFLRRNQSSQMPNFHGWYSKDVIEFASDFGFIVEYDFVYSETVAPTRVISQTVNPGTQITPNLYLFIEISKGREVR